MRCETAFTAFAAKAHVKEGAEHVQRKVVKDCAFHCLPEPPQREPGAQTMAFAMALAPAALSVNSR